MWHPQRAQTPLPPVPSRGPGGVLWRAARCGGCCSRAGYKGRSEGCCQTTAQSGKQLLQAPAHPVSVYSGGTVLFILPAFVYILDKGNDAERFCLVVLFFCLFVCFSVFSISVCFFSISVFFFSILVFFHLRLLLSSSGCFWTFPHSAFLPCFVSLSFQLSVRIYFVSSCCFSSSSFFFIIIIPIFLLLLPRLPPTD